jgi:purine-binding chemotaxis protein CheW
MMGNDNLFGAGVSPETQTDTIQAVSRGGKFLTFFIAKEEYGIEILKVVEIIGLMPITAVPRMPMHVKGVINLRGIIIPVIDLRIKFGMPGIDATEETCIIVVYAGDIQVGVIVDKVSEVLDISDNDIEDTPAFDASVNTDYILGIGKSENNVKLLLDIDKVLPNQEFASIGSDL